MIMILICIALWVIASALVSIFFQNAAKLDKESCIEIKYIDLDNTTLIQELNEADKESKNFTGQVLRQDTLKAIESYYNVKQAMENSLQLIGVSKEELKIGQYRHIEKLRDKGYVFKD